MDLKALRNIPPWDWPDTAAEVLLETLSDRSLAQDERLAAAELVGDCTVIDERIAEVLLSVVGDQDESKALRVQAAVSLGPVLEYVDTMGSEDEDALLSDKAYLGVQSRLRELHEDESVPDDVRRGVLEASVRGPQVWHSAAIDRAYSSDNLAWRLTAVFCMRFVQGFEPRILASLDDDNVEVRRQAVMAAGVWEVDAAWPIVEKILQHSDDKEIVLAAIDAAAEIRPDEALDLLSSLADSDDTDIASSAWEALAMLDSPPTGKISVHDDLLN